MEIVKQEMDKGAILDTEPENFLFDMLSLIFYPLVIGPHYKNISSNEDKEYKKIMSEQKEIILKTLFAK